MDARKLVMMANQIAAFFAAEPDPNVAGANVANHIKRFWEPRMRREILALLDQGSEHGMARLVVEALQQHRATLLPAAG
jgi:formate dehydrogenase subunit delta